MGLFNTIIVMRPRDLDLVSAPYEQDLNAIVGLARAFVEVAYSGGHAYAVYRLIASKSVIKTLRFPQNEVKLLVLKKLW